MNFKTGTLALLLLILGGCSKGYNPDEHLTVQEQYDQVWKIIRYLAKAPENVTAQEKSLIWPAPANPGRGAGRATQ